MALVLISLVSYLLGSIPFAYLVARAYGKNLYQIGSQNIGTANVYRATGNFLPTILSLIGDVGKGALAIYLARRFGFLGYNLFQAQALAAFFVVAGHNWPIFLKFKGGRGLASLIGVLLALKWQVLILTVVVTVLVIILTEYLTKKGIKLEGSFKEKFRAVLAVVISQILGRVLGILASAILIYIYYRGVFNITLAAAVLSGIKHVKRTKDFLEKKQ